jgi:hypothetical protein
MGLARIIKALSMVEAMMPGDGAVMKVSANGLPSPAMR